MKMINLKIVAFTAIIMVFLDISSCSEKRELDFTFNENCGHYCKNKTARLAHIAAKGANDTIHYLYDFTYNPSLLIAVTSSSAKLQISWEDYLNRTIHALNFTEKPIYVFGMVIERLFEFNDIDDTGRIDQIKNQSNIYELHLQNFMWSHKNMTKEKDYVEFYTQADTFKDPAINETRDGSLKFTMHTFGEQGHSHVMPCLFHSENNTQMDIIFSNLKTHKNFTNSRFALELFYTSESDPSSSMKIDTRRKLDDEFTPGIFETVQLTTPFVQNKSAFLEWRPVSYVADERDITNSTGMVSYPFKKPTTENYFPKNSLLYIYYGENVSDLLPQRMNVSFGTTGDGFYNERHYNSWTFIIGYGSPLNERFSKLAIIYMFIGASIPLVVLLLFISYMCWRRTRQDHGERLR